MFQFQYHLDQAGNETGTRADMVLLGSAFSLLKQIPKWADRGLYAGKGIMHGVRITFSNKKTKRAWRPNVQKKRYYSYILGTKLQLRVTCAAMRCIDKAGGFDSYIYHTPDKKLGSKLGSALKRRMFAIVKKYPDIQPPPLVKRYPRPPWSLQTETVSPAGSADTRTREVDRNFKQDHVAKNCS